MRLVAAVLAAGAGLVLLPPAAGASPARCAPPATQVIRGQSWAQSRLDPAAAWPLSQGRGVRVAVLDTGVSAAAPALARAVLPGLDVRDRRPADADCSGHGTFVAGLIAARPRPGTGFAGIAPAATVLPIRVTDDPGQVGADALAAGITAAVDSGATVIALPLGTAADSAALRAAVGYAGRHDALLLAAADTGPGGGRSFPAALPGVLAIAPMDPTGAPVAATTAGPDAPPAPPPALLAPGSMLISLAPTGPGQLAARGGTGLAVAFAAGAAALVRAYRPALSADQVAARLLATADRPPGPVPDRLAGFGAVDPVTAVTAVLPAETNDPPALPRTADAMVHIGHPTTADRGPARRALTLAGTLAAAALAGAALRALLRRGHRRGWHPGDLPG